jgi:hypothetical protein
MGCFSSSSSENTYIKCYWQNYKGEYIPLQLEAELVRLQFNDTITQPYIKFKWHSHGLSFDESYWKYKVIYAVIVLRKDQIITSDKLDLTK